MNKPMKKLQRHLGNESSRIIKNSIWLIYEKVFRMVLTLFVGLWVARYLGPESYGDLNYAIALVSIFFAFITLGLDGVVVKELVRNEKDKLSVLGTSLIMRIFSAIVTIVLLIVSIQLFDFIPNRTVEILVMIFSISLIFKTFETFDLFFQSIIKSKYTVLAKNLSYLISSLLKIVLILMNLSVISFAIVSVLEFFLIGLFLLITYQKKVGDLKYWKFNKNYITELLKESWPLILSGFTISIYMKIDTLMIGSLLKSEDVGLYSAAVKISELWYVIPTSIVSSLAPSIAASKKNSGNTNLKTQKLFDIMVISSLVVAIPVTFLSKYIMIFMFGEEFRGAGTVLSIHIWASIFVFLGVAKTPWLINEKLTKHAFYATASGAIINIIGNLLLIPEIGINGAAISTIVTQFIASVLAFCFFRKTRPLFFMMVKSLYWPFTIFRRNE